MPSKKKNNVNDGKKKESLKALCDKSMLRWRADAYREISVDLQKLADKYKAKFEKEIAKQ